MTKTIAVDAAHEDVESFMKALDEMDNLIIEMARRALYRYEKRRSTGDTSYDDFPINPDTLIKVLEYQLIDYTDDSSTRGILDYITDLPSLRPQWQGISRAILEHYGCDNPRFGGIPHVAWDNWITQVYEAAERINQKALEGLMAWVYLDGGRVVFWENIEEHLRYVDSLLSKLKGRGEKGIGQEFADSMEAVVQVTRRGGGFDNETMSLYKSELRTRRATISGTTNTISKLQQGSFSSLDNDPQDNALDIVKGDHWKPSIFATTLTLILISTVFLIQGWQASPHIPGTSSDADFWFLLLSVTTQLSSITPTVIGFWTNPVQSRQVSWWIWTLIGISASCTLTAPVLYVLIPTEWSAMVGFFGSVALAFVVLEAMFVSTPSKEKIS